MQRKPPPVAPTCFVPSCPADFVGQAGKVAEVLLRKAERLRANPDQPLPDPLSIGPPPATGKRSSRAIPRPAVGCSYWDYPSDRGRGQGQCQGRDGGFGDVDAVKFARYNHLGYSRDGTGMVARKAQISDLEIDRAKSWSLSEWSFYESIPPCVCRRHGRRRICLLPGGGIHHSRDGHRRTCGPCRHRPSSRKSA